MSVLTSIPQKPTARNVELLSSPERDDEMWVLPSPVLGVMDLPSLRHLLPAGFADAPVVDFQPVPGTFGAWILRKAAESWSR